MHHECQQLGRLFDSMDGADSFSFDHRKLTKSLYSAADLETASKLVEESCPVLKIELESKEFKLESVQIAISRIHGSLSVWFDTKNQIDVEVSACLSAAIVALIYSKVTSLPKKAGIVIS